MPLPPAPFTVRENGLVRKVSMPVDWNVAQGMAFVEALALKWTSDYLDTLLAQPNIGDDSMAVAGFGLSTNLLKLFAAEIALKALCIREHGQDAPHTHDLYDLFSALGETTQAHIHKSFIGKRLINAALQVLATENGISFNNFLVDLKSHSKSFVEWRYFYARTPETDLHTDFIFLNTFLESLLETYQAKE